MAPKFRSDVQERADNRCEYCGVSALHDRLPFQIDHVVPLKHHGESILDNLAWSCFDCNVFKGTNIAGIDPETGQLTRLYHPRLDAWREHFRWAGSKLSGITPVGRATVDVLRINLPTRVEHRRLLAEAGVVFESL